MTQCISHYRSLRLARSVSVSFTAQGERRSTAVPGNSLDSLKLQTTSLLAEFIFRGTASLTFLSQGPKGVEGVGKARENLLKILVLR